MTVEEHGHSHAGKGHERSIDECGKGKQDGFFHTSGGARWVEVYCYGRNHMFPVVFA